MSDSNTHYVMSDSNTHYVMSDSNTHYIPGIKDVSTAALSFAHFKHALSIAQL